MQPNSMPTVQYESERLKYAQDLINFDKKWSKLFRDKPQTEENADGVSHDEFLGSVPSIFSLFLSYRARLYSRLGCLRPRMDS